MLLQAAARDYPRLDQRCADFDRELMADLTQAGRRALRPDCARWPTASALAACGLAADANKQPLFFTKENTSNGDIATVDVFFPDGPACGFCSAPRWPRPRSCRS